MSSRIAVVLRGPTGFGKTEVGEALLRSLAQRPNQLINLDNGWSDQEYRCTRVPERYHDLGSRQEPELVIELANGEPVRHVLEFLRMPGSVDSSFWRRAPGPGATVNPLEWVTLLRSDGCEVRSFLLSADWGVICMRRKDFPHLERWHQLYREPDWLTFASRAGIPEERINSDVSPATEIAKSARVNS